MSCRSNAKTDYRDNRKTLLGKGNPIRRALNRARCGTPDGTRMKQSGHSRSVIHWISIRYKTGNNCNTVNILTGTISTTASIRGQWTRPKRRPCPQLVPLILGAVCFPVICVAFFLVVIGCRWFRHGLILPLGLFFRSHGVVAASWVCTGFRLCCPYRFISEPFLCCCPLSYHINPFPES